MFNMEEVGSPRDGPRNGCAKSRVAFQDSNASDDDEEDDEDDLRICPITDDLISPTKGFFDYPKDVVRHQQLSNSLPKNSFTYRVSLSPVNLHFTVSNNTVQEVVLDVEYSHMSNTARLRVPYCFYKTVTT